MKLPAEARQRIQEALRQRKRPFRDVYRSGSWEVTVKGRRACSGAWQPIRDAFVLALGARSMLVGVGRGRNVTGRRRTVPSIVVG